MVEQNIDVSDIDPTRSYTVKEVAGMIHYNVVYLRDLIRDKKIKAFKPMGGNIRIPGKEVRRLVAGVNDGSGLSVATSTDDVDKIEVPAELAEKILPGGPAAEPAPPSGEDEDSGEGGAFRHLIEVK